MEAKHALLVTNADVFGGPYWAMAGYFRQYREIVKLCLPLCDRKI